MRRGRIEVGGQAYVHADLHEALVGQNLEMGLEQNRQRRLMNELSRRLETSEADRGRALQEVQTIRAQRDDLTLKIRELHQRLMENL